MVSDEPEGALVRHAEYSSAQRPGVVKLPVEVIVVIVVRVRLYAVRVLYSVENTALIEPLELPEIKKGRERNNFGTMGYRRACGT